MKLKKLIIFILIILFIFFTYFFFKDEKLNYVSLGDSVAAGHNPYGQLGYGYTNYLKDYLESNNKLKDYANFAVSGYMTKDVINDIKNNREITIDNRTRNIREVLRESNVVTISIGANDFMSGITLNSLDLNDIDKYLKKIDGVSQDIDETLKIVREYAKQDIIVIGYYNPFPILYKTNPNKIDNLFNYVDRKYIEICDKYDIKFLSVYDLFKNNSKFLPNPFDIHPNIDGYKAIGNELIKTYFE